MIILLKRQLRAAAVSLFATACIIATPALAHHSVAAEFDQTKTVEIEGTLKKIELVNPHSQMQLLVKDNVTGNIDTYQLLSAGANAFRRPGKPSLVVGDVYKVQIHPARRGANRGVVTAITFPDGDTVQPTTN